MDQSIITDYPTIYPQLEAKCKEIGFSMPSDVYIGTLLKTLITAKPGGNFLELGTGIGLSLSWMIDGMDQQARITSIDNDPALCEIARTFFGQNPQVDILCVDGSEWIKNYQGDQFDLIFADAWPGKYSELNETLALVKVGGLYVIDDMNPQANWQEGHQAKAQQLITELENRSDINLTKMDWSSGVMICTKKA
ncbi:MAG: class I SAM-dependent methyltransferase [Bacteroidota bacterium]